MRSGEFAPRLFRGWGRGAESAAVGLNSVHWGLAVPGELEQLVVLQSCPLTHRLPLFPGLPTSDLVCDPEKR